MDTFTEQLTKRRLTIPDYILIVSVFLFIVIEPILYILLLRIFPFLDGWYLIFFVISVYIGMKLISSRFIEFEYIVTGSNLSIDKVIMKKTRKSVLSFEIGDIDRLSRYDKSVDLSDCNKIYNTQAEGERWYMLLKDEKMKKVAIIFSPNEKTLLAMKPFLKRQVQVDVFGRN